MWESIQEAARAWAPALVATAAGITLVGLADRLFRARTRRSLKPEHGLLSGPLITFALTAMVLVGVILLLPIGDTARGQLLGLLGLLATAAIALSSTTFVGNAMAGLMLRSMRNFHPGDFIRVGEHTGRVSGQGLLYTEVQTEDRDLTTVPNLFMVTNPVTVMRSSGTVVSATVSLGYDVPRERVEPLLIEAAKRADLNDAFVQIAELGDYAVTYRAAGILEEVKQLLTTRSRLRAAILDELHGDGIEIVSPAFMNQRLLARGQTFVPGPARVPQTVAPRPPEAVIFDKAEEAEETAKLALELETLTARAEELKRELAAAEMPADRLPREEELSETELRIAQIEERLAGVVPTE